jgi:hypothetical protein
MEPVIVGSIIAGIATIVGAWISRAKARGLKREEAKRIEELEQAFKSQVSDAVRITTTSTTPISVNLGNLIGILSATAGTALFTVSGPGIMAGGRFTMPSKEEIQSIVEKSVEPLRKEIMDIKFRSSNDAAIDKDTLVKIALFESTVEHLATSVKELKENILTRWDVVVVVLTILSGVSVFVGLVTVAVTIFSFLVGGT